MFNMENLSNKFNMRNLPAIDAVALSPHRLETPGQTVDLSSKDSFQKVDHDSHQGYEDFNLDTAPLSAIQGEQVSHKGYEDFNLDK